MVENANRLAEYCFHKHILATFSALQLKKKTKTKVTYYIAYFMAHFQIQM